MNASRGPERVVAACDNVTSSPFHQVREWLRRGHPRVLAFLRRKGNGWVLNDSPYYPGRGILNLDEAQAADIAAKVPAHVARLSLDSLAAHADLVVLGTVIGNVSCLSEAGIHLCRVLRIDVHVVGQAESSTIPIYSLFTGAIPERQCLYFLEQIKGGAYRLSPAGMRPLRVESGVIRYQGADHLLQRTIERIRTLRRALRRSP